MDSKQLITNAIKLIEENGWTQGSYRKYNAFCMLGALHYAATGSAFTPPSTYTLSTDVAVFNKAIKCIMATIPWHEMDPYYVQVNAKVISAFNDYPSRTKDDVLSVMRQAAENCNGNS